MNDLRWILIAGGAALLAAIYLWGRRGEKRSKGSDENAFEHSRLEPQREPSFNPPLYEDIDEELPVAEDSEAHRDEDRLTSRPMSRTQTVAETGRYEGAVRGMRGTRVEPTLGASPAHQDTIEEPDELDPAVTVELPARENVSAPTLGMSSTPAPRRIERRKIIALRLAAGGQRFAGEVLRNSLESESLQFGRYDVFHRLDQDGSSIFSVASMVEPGTFELDRMAGQQYAGVTMFAQLPGPVPGVQALQELVACGRRLQEMLGGTLQDERGVPLTVHRIDRLRQEVVDFERAQARDQRATPPSH